MPRHSQSVLLGVLVANPDLLHNIAAALSYRSITNRGRRITDASRVWKPTMASGIAWWPGTIVAGRISDHISAGWDLLPTFAELAKAKAKELFRSSRTPIPEWKWKSEK